MATVVTKRSPTHSCQFVAVWKYNDQWWSKAHQVVHDDGSLKEWRDAPGNGLRLEEAHWYNQPWINGDATEFFFIYDEEE